MVNEFMLLHTWGGCNNILARDIMEVEVFNRIIHRNCLLISAFSKTFIEDLGKLRIKWGTV